MLTAGDEYRRNALRAFNFANNASDPQNKAALRTVAFGWLLLAEMVDGSIEAPLDQEQPVSQRAKTLR
jgi:hypothetical protein